MFPVCRYRNILTWLLVLTQLMTSTLSWLPALAHADTPAGMQGTVQGLDALIRGESAGRAAGADDRRAAPPVASLSAGTHGLPPAPSVRPDVPAGLPDLTWPVPGDGGVQPKKQEDKPADTPSGVLASGAMQAGSLLSGDDRTDAAINYAKGIGEGLINQKVNDWLNQFGNAKVSLGTDGQFSGDILFPLHDTDTNLFFTQLGARRGQERNLVNVGAGYRAYTDDWMLGGNVFYDYDYTGKNRRLGVGGELWRDYLKLSANGYFRLTNWHQSVLSEMEDYDERPANGFDVRAEGYLPAWPQLGGSLKYEQYFGKGVSVADSASPDTLKDSPVVLTAGLSYTPFPLMTLSASRSVGDSNDTRLALDLSYRLGVPWSEQVSPGGVDLMRSLAGNKYDLADRNYNIVMQYRKQELLRIQLPERRTAQAAETITVPLTVSRAKYGLKGVNWTVSPELTARGGRYRIVSPTEIQVTLPAYVFTNGQKTPQTYQVSAAATDNHDNQSNTTTMLIDVVPSENTVSHLTLSPGDRSVLANDTESYTITGAVTDGKGASLANQKVTFAVDGLINTAGQAGTTLAPVGGGKGDSRQLTVTTGTDGKATITLRSKVAGEGKIAATMDNGNSSAAKVTFVADSTTAAVRKVTLMDDTTAKPADGKNTFTYSALVKDKYDNTLANEPVSWAVDAAGVTLSDPTTQTDSNGKATVKLLSGTRVVTNIMVSAHSAAQAADIDADKKVSFTAGNIAPDKSTLVASPDSITANGQASSTLTLTLVDANNNLITGAASSLHASVAGLDNVSVSNFTEQGATGVYVATLTGTRAGIATITALSGSKKASAQTPTVTFIADKTTALIKDMTIAPDGAAADGKAANGVKVTVTDKQGNPVPEVTVTFSVNNGATLTTVNGVSDANGVATATVTSTKVGRYTVTASVNGQATTKETTFVADVATAHVSKVALVGSTNSLPANGQSRFSYIVTVVDNQGNTVSGVKVIPKADKPGVTATAAGVTDAGGQTTVTLTGTTKAVADITVSAQVGTTTSESADKTVSFTADSASAQVSAVTLVGSDVSKVADGKNTFTYTVTVKDSNGNPVSGATVLPKADKPGVSAKASGTTDASGQATVTLTSTTKAVADITVSAQVGSTAAKNADKTVSFTADSTTAQVSTVTLDGSEVSKVADGKNTFTYTVTVKDSNGNPVSGATVSPKADKAGVTAASNGVTDASGQTTIILTSTTKAVANITVSAQAGTTASKNADKAVSFIAGGASTTNSTLTLSASRIVANNNSNKTSTDGIDYTTLTLKVVDAYANGVTGIKDKIAFVVSDSNGNAVSSGVTVGSVTESSTAGQYTARIYGNRTGTYTIKVKVDDTYLGSLSKQLVLYSYSFALNEITKSIVVGGTYKFIVQATPTDTGSVENVSADVSWTSGNNSVVTVASTGITTGVAAGTTTIKATGAYNGLDYNLTADLTVRGAIESTTYGTSRPGDTFKKYIIEPPSYSISIRSSSLIDAIGTPESLTGGVGGQLATIDNVNAVKSIQVTVGTWNGASNGPYLARLIFNMSDGKSIISGNLVGVSGTTVSTFTIPDGYVLQGIVPGGSNYIRTIKFITMPTK